MQRQLLTNTMINPLSYILLYFSLIRKPENRSVRTRKRILKEFSNYCFPFKLPIWQGFMFSLQDNACNFLAIFVTILFAQNWYIEGVSSSEKKGILFSIQAFKVSIICMTLHCLGIGYGITNCKMTCVIR